MGIYIKGMEMPTSCYKCLLRRRDGMDIVCPVAHERFSVADVNILKYRLDNCPLVSVPPHGRCVDVDALKIEVFAHDQLMKDGWNNMDMGMFTGNLMEVVAAAPTIIEAEENK